VFSRMRGDSALAGKLPVARGKTVRERQIEATDGQIDQLVCELYGLSDKEIAIVEEATRCGAS
jgi:hypothetical protein